MVLATYGSGQSNLEIETAPVSFGFHGVAEVRRVEELVRRTLTGEVSGT